MTPEELIRVSRARMMVRSGVARSVRLASGLSLSEVARAVGVTTVCVWRWERRQRLPRGEPAARYADLLERLIAGAAL